MHGMHSVTDWLAFAIWEDGKPIRSLSLSPGNGIMGEHITDPTGQEQVARQAVYAQARKALGTLRRFRRGPDGTMHEVSPAASASRTARVSLADSRGFSLSHEIRPTVPHGRRRLPGTRRAYA